MAWDKEEFTRSCSSGVLGVSEAESLPSGTTGHVLITHLNTRSGKQPPVIQEPFTGGETKHTVAQRKQG